jgi:hypothetical protein
VLALQLTVFNFKACTVFNSNTVDVEIEHALFNFKTWTVFNANTVHVEFEHAQC